jgi:hypothetical protein
MNNSCRITTVFLSTLFLAVLGVPQTAVAPPPKPVDNAPTLAATLQFIQDRLNDIGKVPFIEYLQDANDGSTFNSTWTDEVSNVVADPAHCRISFHWRVTKDGSPAQDKDLWFSLSTVEQIVAKPYAQYQTESDASSGAPNIVTTATNPSLTALLVQKTHNGSNLFPFTNPELADRVAKAFTHAVELCGRGNKDPF